MQPAITKKIGKLIFIAMLPCGLWLLDPEGERPLLVGNCYTPNTGIGRLLPGVADSRSRTRMRQTRIATPGRPTLGREVGHRSYQYGRATL